ncbi:GroES-like protein [Dacryopinax primogenitus]|uniref:GroES-like protein n=1 Tax=Dacryopinax primogenitus (strain DJM 731) TaxID=1858805 RepID=M5FYL5_DACPD|nr:GroES-like protein [Dacryopinax primogenitus]EJT98636.1 GroES-like protein [Dacryopinax primogenitus]
MALPFIALSITEHHQKTPLTLLPFDEPQLGEGELLIANAAVAQNPVDWKQIDFDFGILGLPWVVGGDVAGTVYKVGPGVEGFKVGDRVISFVSRTTARHSAFQTYSIGLASRTVPLPSTYTFEQGSTIPLTFVTAGAGLEAALGIKLPAPPAQLPEASKGEPLLVWGGSSSVGAFVIQLAKVAGYTVLSTASPKNHAYVKSLGASEVFDYHDPDVVNKIRLAAGPNLSKVYDSISENGSIEASVASITAPSGVVAAILTPKPEQSTASVKVVQTGAIRAQENPEIGKRVYGVLTALLEKGLLVPNPVKVIPGGLLGINEGLQLGREHKVSGEKLVYVVADTKF